MATIKFYTVTMPDGKDYTAEGRSIKQVAAMYGVSERDVWFGSTFKLPLISEYYQNQERKDDEV